LATIRSNRSTKPCTRPACGPTSPESTTTILPRVNEPSARLPAQGTIRSRQGKTPRMMPTLLGPDRLV
jgi:hypothetical protein